MSPEAHAEALASVVDAVVHVIQTDSVSSPSQSSPAPPRPLGSALSLLLDFFESKEGETPLPSLFVFLSGAPASGLGVRSEEEAEEQKREHSKRTSR